MKEPWSQQTLLPLDVFEVQLSLGVVNSGDHFQWLLAVTEPSTGSVVAMESCPHAPIAELQAQLIRALEATATELEGRVWAV